MKKVLIIEDDCRLAELVEIHLKDLGCQVTIHHNGKEGLTAARETPFKQWKKIIVS